MHLETASDLDWKAFLYVSGELSPAEASAFELLLLEDQPAREAVASAVELAGALALASDGTVLPLPPRRSLARRAGWAAAALVAAAAGLFAMTRPGEPAETGSIALAWSGLRADGDGEWTSVVVDGAEAPATSEGEPVADVESDAASDSGVPSWMLAAAAPEADGPPREGN